MYRAGMAAILSQLVRDGRLAVVDSISIDAPKTKLLAAKFKAMGLAPTPRIGAGDRRPDRRQHARWPRATWPTCWSSSRVTPIRCRWCFFKKVLVTKGAIEQLKEMFA